MDPRLVSLLEQGLAMGAVDFKRLEFLRTEQWKTLVPVFERYDALLCPTMSQTARPVDEDDFIWYAPRDDGLYHGLDLTSVFNYVSQCPALSVWRSASARRSSGPGPGLSAARPSRTCPHRFGAGAQRLAPPDPEAS
jgi:Asp-tRNA(Asn)/Glu-tRNA(Gln) amidotransferase A subunit family amidase